MYNILQIHNELMCMATRYSSQRCTIITQYAITANNHQQSPIQRILPFKPKFVQRSYHNGFTN